MTVIVPPRRGAADLAYRLLLLTYPSAFRREFGDDMIQLFRDRRREARRQSVRHVVHLWARVLRDTATHACLERFHPLQRRGAGDPTPHAFPTGPSHRDPPRHTTQKGWRAMLDILRQDIAYAFRTFRRNPGFTGVAIVTLALGIGANTAIFSLINGVLLTPLQFGEPNELVVVYETSARENVEASRTAIGTFTDWRERNRTLDDVTMWTYDSFILQEDDAESVALTGIYTYPNFFTVMRINPLFGRTFVMDDAEPGQRGNVIIISHALWRDRWGADPGVVGQTVRLDGAPVTIIGVMRPDVAAPEPDVDIWIPAAAQSRIRWERHSRRWMVYGRIAAGANMALVQDDLARVHRELAAGEYSDIYDGWTTRIVPLRDEIVGNVGSTLIIAFASVGLVLLIACVNIANMLLARAAARQREIAVRSALGAGRQRITRQLLTESVLLGLGGGVIGVVFARLTHSLILAFEPGIIPRAEELSLDSAALVFAIGVSVVTGILFGLMPALQSARVDLQDSLKQGSGKVTSGRSQNRMRGVLVASQLALATVLLSGAGLLIRSMLELSRVDPGFEAENTVAARIFLDRQRYADSVRVTQYYYELGERLAALPGVDRVGGTSALPMDPMGINYDLPYRLEGQEALDDNELPQADFRVVTPGYFETMGIPIVAGRAFNESDRPETVFVALVNQAMVDAVWPDQNPIGQRFYTPSTSWHWFEIVGIVGNTRYYGLDADPRPEMYVVHAQVPREEMTYVVRTAGAAANAVDGVRRAVIAQDPAQPTHGIVPIEELISETIAAERFYALVLGIFAGVALLLSGAGIYGVLSYWVNQRTHEIGVRMALGAGRSNVLKLVVGHGMGLTGIGLGVGLVGALASTRVLSNVLYGVGASDPVTFTAVVAVLGGFALFACWVPAFRASRVNPVVALREE